MTLTRKIILAIAITVMAFSAANLLIVNQLLGATFGGYEDKEVSRNTSRIMQLIDATYDRMSLLDWAMWSDTYNYVLGTNDEYIEANLDFVTLSNIGVNFIALATTASELKIARHIDLEFKRDMPWDESFLPPFIVNHLPLKGDGANIITRGILATSQGPMYVASYPILQDGGEGPPAGALVMGRLMDETWRREIMDQARVEFRLHNLQTGTTTAYQEDIVAQLQSRDSWAIKDKALVRDYSLMRDIEGAATLLVEVITPREITMQRERVQLIGTGSVLVSGLIILLVLTYALQRMVVGPLGGLTRHIAGIDKTDEFRPNDYAHKSDEVGILAQQFDALMLDYKNADANWRLPSLIARRSNHPIVFTDQDGRIEYANPAFEDVMRATFCERDQCTLREIFAAQGLGGEEFDNMLATVKDGKAWTIEFADAAANDPVAETRILAMPVNAEDGVLVNISVYYSDITETKSLERQLMQAKKLESVGQLAAGIAHEINTPAQYVSDNISFFNDSIEDISGLLTRLGQLSSEEGSQVSSDAIRTALDEADAQYLQEELPKAIAEAQDGVGRISKIVKAMKNFAHPSTELAQVDINQAIESTVTVASNEWKYVAEMNLELCADMPTVLCNAGQINQVVLNIVINAAHALAERDGAASAQKGAISITTTHANGWAEIRIADNGPGIPDGVREKIFDPFFTTKEVGKGTGQGLSIAYDVVVNKHGGKLEVTSAPNEGACFIIHLPLESKEEAA